MSKEREFDYNYNDFKEISDLVYKAVGIVLKDCKQDLVYTRIARRIRILDGVSDFREYLDLLKGPDGKEEVEDFINAVTTNHTKFFREPHHFESLANFLKEAVGDSKRSARIRIWSAACSMGNEPYSMAMTIYENINTEMHDIKNISN